MDIRQMKLSDLTTLYKICCDAYSQNFSDHWEDGGSAYYLDKVFGIETLETELSDKNIHYHVAFINDDPVAFMKLNLFSNLPDFDKEKGLELDKVYILPQFKGMKIGKRLLDLAFDIAKCNKKEVFWLSVLDTNKEAISFHEKAGFQFHSKTQLDYLKFKKELKGMWRMYFELPFISN
jgi:diamine N-acetyltransferase